MAPANCARCKRLFNRIHSPICDSCLKEEEKMYDIVYEFLVDNPNKTIQEIADETNVPEKIIIKFVRDGRFLGSVDFEAIKIPCAKCGIDILTGMYCEDCQMEMKSNLKGAMTSKNTKKKKATIMSDKVKR
ncbi:MAG: hypothetical protein ACK5LV_09445 [Lachnospirales bacterium]